MAYLKPWEPGITLNLICLVSLSRRIKTRQSVLVVTMFCAFVLLLLPKALNSYSHLTPLI